MTTAAATPPSPNYIDPVFTNFTEQTITYATRKEGDYNASIFTPVGPNGEPVGAKKKPVVIVLHPGGSDYTDPGTIHWAKEEFATRGYIGIAAEYKLTHGDFTAELQRQAVINVLALVRFLRLNKERYNIKGKNILLFGTSAGAITAGQSNLSANALEDPYFEDEVNKLYLKFPDGGKIKSNVLASGTKAGAATEVFLKFLDAEDAPWYDYHGELDTKVNYKQAVKTIDAMVALRIPSTLMSFPDTGHEVGHDEEVKGDLFPKFAATLV